MVIKAEDVKHVEKNKMMQSTSKNQIQSSGTDVQKIRSQPISGNVIPNGVTNNDLRKLMEKNPGITVDLNTKEGRVFDAQLKLKQLELDSQACKTVQEKMKKNKMSKEEIANTMWGDCLTKYEAEKVKIEKIIKENK